MAGFPEEQLNGWWFVRIHCSLVINTTGGSFWRSYSSIHLAAAIGTGNCPGSPQLAYSFGRPPPVAPAPDLTVPEPTGDWIIVYIHRVGLVNLSDSFKDSVTDILARFSEAGFVTAEVIWLLASHSIASAVSSWSSLSFCWRIDWP